MTAAMTLLSGPALAQSEVSLPDDQAGYEYDPTGKRDPFRPLFLLRRPAAQSQQPLTPLQRYEIGQLRLVGIVYNLAPPRAMVEDSSGLGFIVTPGTPIGPNGGVVTAIRPRQVVVEEWQTDVIGERHRRELLLELPPDEAEPSQ
jgi:type IV pilus assembly protein PilP